MEITDGKVSKRADDARLEHGCRLGPARGGLRTLHTRQLVRYAAAVRPRHVSGTAQDITERRRARPA